MLLGNCGVSFAPCHDDQRDMLINLMEGVEDIPEVVMTAGLPWNWHSFPDYLDAIAQRRYDVDVATQVPHAALRVYVMGERAPIASRRRLLQIVSDFEDQMGESACSAGWPSSRGGPSRSRCCSPAAPHKYHSGRPGCPRLLIKKSATHSCDALNCASKCRHERA